MIREKIGKITEKEKAELQSIHARLDALAVVVATLQNKGVSTKTVFWRKVTDDIQSTRQAYKDWWLKYTAKYEWEHIDGSELSLDYMSNTVYMAFPNHAVAGG